MPSLKHHTSLFGHRIQRRASFWEKAALRILDALDRTPITRKLKHSIELNYILKKCAYLFDENYYLSQNADVRTYSGGPLLHFVRYGHREGRKPHPLFDTAYYRTQSEVHSVGVNPLLHFYIVGRRSFVSPTRFFSYEHYLTVNEDVRRAQVDPFRHYIEYGLKENRMASPNFDPKLYMSQNKEAKNGGWSALIHYLRLREKPSDPKAEYGPVIDVNGSRLIPKVGGARPCPNLLSAILAIPVPNSDREPKIDVIIPVYRDYQLTLGCIASVLRVRDQSAYDIIVIDDYSPEPELSDALDRIATAGLITLIKHRKNAGFVKSVNDGMKLHTDRDVILLNSDTEVFGDWASRLARTAYASDDIATVCPLTNSGTICSYPLFAKDNAIPEDIDPETLDDLAKRVNAGKYVDAPTAVGFCMFIKRSVLDQAGLFDDASFGTGYGEENDFCLRAQALGWHDVIAVDVFVRHFGTASFLGEKSERTAHALKVINARYPHYRATVRNYINRDPARKYRAAIDIERLKRLKRAHNVLMISHTRGGGTEQHIQQRISYHRERQQSVFRLHSKKNSKEARIIHSDAPILPNIRSFDFSVRDDEASFLSLLSLLSIDEMEIHHLADFGGNAPEIFGSLAEQSGLSYRFYVHDYLSICPRINLVDELGLYCGEPDADGCTNCLVTRGSGYGQPNIKEWRARYERFLKGAARVIAPTQDTQTRLQFYFPDMDIDVEPHEKLVTPFLAEVPRAKRNDGRFRVGTIGAISDIKGLRVLHSCSEFSIRTHTPLDFVVIGTTSDNKKSSSCGISITGRYKNDNVFNMIKEQEIDLLFLPSTCPETYSFTLTISLQTGLPVVAFDIGAMGERLVDYRFSHLLPLERAHDIEFIVEHLMSASRLFSGPNPVQRAVGR